MNIYDIENDIKEKLSLLRAEVVGQYSDVVRIKGENSRMADELLACATTRTSMIRDRNELVAINANLEDEAARLRDEHEKIFDQYRTRGVELERQAKEIERLRDENERLKVDHAALLGGDRDWMCVWCKSTLPNDEESVKKHAFECKYHPATTLKLEVDRLRADNDLLVAKLGTARECNRLYESALANAGRKPPQRKGLYRFSDWVSAFRDA